MVIGGRGQACRARAEAKSGPDENAIEIHFHFQ
jgi:hypothetical protein